MQTHIWTNGMLPMCGPIPTKPKRTNHHTRGKILCSRRQNEAHLQKLQRLHHEHGPDQEPMEFLQPQQITSGNARIQTNAFGFSEKRFSAIFAKHRQRLHVQAISQTDTENKVNVKFATTNGPDTRSAFSIKPLLTRPLIKHSLFQTN